MEFMCLFCSTPIPPLSPEPSSLQTDNTHLEQLFRLISTSLSVEEDVLTCWNFKDEGLPFCTPCHHRVRSYWELSQQMDSIQLQITMILEEFKNIVRNSAKIIKQEEGISLVASVRFDNFRQQVLFSGGQNRGICSQRLAQITGLCGSDSASLSSWDELSTNDDVMAGSPNSCSEPGETEMPLFSTNHGDIIFNCEPAPCTNSGSDFVNELLQDPQDPTSAFSPQWTRSIDNIDMFGYIQVFRPTSAFNYWKCGADECNFKLKNGDKNQPKRVMQRHIEKDHYNWRKCPRGCGETFKSEAAMENHVCKGSKKKTTKTCKKCRIVFENLSLLKVHVCQSKETRSDTEHSPPMKRRLNNKKSPPTFKCEVENCLQVLSSKAALQRHADLHNKSPDKRKSAVCEYCGKSYSKPQLVQHLRSHGVGTPLPEFKCQRPNCTKSFPHLAKLNRHEKSHEPKRNRI